MDHHSMGNMPFKVLYPLEHGMDKNRPKIIFGQPTLPKGAPDAIFQATYLFGEGFFFNRDENVERMARSLPSLV